MPTIDHPAADVWYIAHDGTDIVHYGVVCPCTRMDTSQPTLEQFATEAEMLVRLAELGVVMPVDEAPLTPA